MKNLTIKSKIFVLVVIGLIGTIFASYMTISNAQQGKKSLDDFIQKAVIPSNKLEKLEESIDWTYSNMVEVTSDFAPTVASYDLMLEKFKEIDKHFSNLNDEIFIQNKDLISKIKEDWSSMKIVINEKILPAYEDEDIEVVGEVAQVDVSPFFFSMKKSFKKLETNVQKYYSSIQTNSIESLNNSTQFSIMISAILIIAVLIVAYYIALKEFIKPIKEFQQGLLAFFDYMNKKTQKTVLLDENRDDEFGEMAKVLNKSILDIEKNLKIDLELIEDTTYITNKVKKGDLTSRVTKSSNNNELNRLKDVINQMIDAIHTNIDKNLVVLDSYSKLNYTKKIENLKVEAQLAQLSNGINNLGDTISEMLSNSLNNGKKLKQNADILEQNVDTISQSSNQGAAALEETAAALEEVTGTIVRSSDNIGKMSGYAKELTNAVTHGEELAHKTTNAMDEINNQVNSINEAITVIDQIAFQTNILSLNAAVEAATAGEAGKGFAVVAQEVRNLAARSAEAAKEIKDLVENATAKANDGKSISDDMINGYTSLNKNIQDTLGLINIVSQSAQSQREGIEQINDAITNLDQQTQANASAANQTKDVATVVNNMAENIVNDTNNKEFIGK